VTEPHDWPPEQSAHWTLRPWHSTAVGYPAAVEQMVGFVEAAASRYGTTYPLHITVGTSEGSGCSATPVRAGHKRFTTPWRIGPMALH
jgi:hypothetical protein